MFNMRFVFGNLIHWRRHSSWQEKLKAKLWKQGIPPLMTIIMEVFLLLGLQKPTRLTPQQLEEKREKGLCYNCDRKCTKGHKYAKKKLFYIEHEEEEEKDQETSKEEDVR